MANYYVLDCMGEADELQFTLEVDLPNLECWKMGRAFSTADRDSDFHPPADIIELETDVDSKAPERTYPELTWHPVPLMSRRLVEALRAVGVDNLQTYETRLTNPQHKTPADYYLAVNVIGLVAAADLGESELSPETEDRLISADFNSLAVDPQKARDTLMFRLAENVSAVLVHERVRRFVEDAGIDTLTWFEPESWAG